MYVDNLQTNVSVMTSIVKGHSLRWPKGGHFADRKVSGYNKNPVIVVFT